MVQAVRAKIIRFVLMTAVISLLVTAPLLTPSPTYAGECPTVGQDCTG